MVMHHVESGEGIDWENNETEEEACIRILLYSTLDVVRYLIDLEFEIVPS
jgi:hypothetical protein